ncbi:hypothetical protein [Pontimicrobium sp. MEBiC06410]
MKTNKTIFALLAFFIISLLPAQVSLNEYKYVIVPNKFEFLKEADQYRLNSLTQYLFQKNGFIAVMEEGKLPEEIVKNSCLALKADVLSNSGMFKTKLKVELKNCNGEVVYTSLEGTSREKKYAVAYNNAIRAAFNSFKDLNYKYEPNEKTLAMAEAETKKEEEIKRLKEEIKSLKAVEEKVKVVELVKTEVKKPIEKEVEKEIKKDNIKTFNKDVLYAQPTNTGFQLVDTTPKVVYTLYASGQEHIFIVKGRDAVIYKVDTAWVIAEQKGNRLEKKNLNIKF